MNTIDQSVSKSKPSCNLMFFLCLALTGGLLLRLLHALYFESFWPLIDDSYYCFDIARNIAEGHGVSTGGIPTCGFQPLYTFLCVPFFWIFKSDIKAIHAVLIVMAFLTSMTPLLLYVTLRRMGSPMAGVLIAVIWALSPYVISNDMNGLETGLTGLFLVVSLNFYIQHIRMQPDPCAFEFIWLGLLLGLCVLSRIDQGLWCVAIALDYLVRGESYKSFFATRIKSISITAGVALALNLPWFLYCHKITGNLMPSSGNAVRFISLAYGFQHWGGIGEYLSDDIPNLKYTFLTIMSAIKELENSFDFIRTLATGRGILILVASLAFACRKRIMLLAREYLFLFVYPVLLILAYSFWIYGQWFFARYFYTAVLLGRIIAVMTIAPYFSKLRSSSKVFNLTLSLIVFVLCIAAWNSVPQTLMRSLNNRVIVSGEPFMSVIPEGQTIGRFQSGQTSFVLRNNRVINLDGVVNHRALETMKQDGFDKYLHKEGVEWLVDWGWIIDALYCRKAGVIDPLENWELRASDGRVKIYKRKTH